MDNVYNKETLEKMITELDEEYKKYEGYLMQGNFSLIFILKYINARMGMIESEKTEILEMLEYKLANS